MSTTTITTSRRFVGLVAALAVATSGALVSSVAHAETHLSGPPASTKNIAPPGVPRPIEVADAYHGYGIRFCLDGKQPVVVADAYHGVGVAVCF